MPKNPDYVSGSLELSSNVSENRIEVYAQKVKTIMVNNNHSHIDIIKMDIEGSEFDVISDMLKDHINFSQLCVETHARFFKDGNKRLKKMISDLNNAEYKIFYVSDNGEELSFIKDIIK